MKSIIHKNMDHLTLEQINQILLTYDNIQTGNVNEQEIQDTFDILPVKNSGLNNFTRMKGINTYVIFNNQDLLDMKTKLIIEQSDQGEQTGDYALDSSAMDSKPKNKRRFNVLKLKGRKK